MDVCDTNFDAVLAVYTGTQVNALTQVAADDDDCEGLGARVGFAATAGTVYKVAVAGFNGAAGSFTLAVSQAPVAVDDARTVGEDSGATNFQVLANDTDAEGDAIEITAVADPQHGTATIVQGAQGAPDQIAYTPDADSCNDPGAAPTDDFSYTVIGGDTATVAVTVTCVEDVAVARDDAVTVLEDANAALLAVLANDSDAEGDPIAITAVSTAAHGTVARVDSSPDKVSYTPFADYCNEPGPAAPDSFTYTLEGGDTATVSVTVTCADDNSNANDDAATVGEDAAGALIDVLANDTDGEGDAIEITGALGSPQGSVAVVQGAPDRLAYTPAANYCNSPGGVRDAVSYSVNGGDTATVLVTVTCVQDARDRQRRRAHGRRGLARERDQRRRQRHRRRRRRDRRHGRHACAARNDRRSFRASSATRRSPTTAARTSRRTPSRAATARPSRSRSRACPSLRCATARSRRSSRGPARRSSAAPPAAT